MKLFNSTKKWVDWWKDRKVDWAKQYMNPNHPHRIVIAEVLKHINWLSLIEVGCGAGANLAQIVKSIPERQVGGIDVNPQAIEFAQTQFKNGVFSVGKADDIMMSDQSCDIILSDMC